MADDRFELYDLKVRVEEIRGPCAYDHQVGDCFALRAGKLSLPPGQSFWLHALAQGEPIPGPE